MQEVQAVRRGGRVLWLRPEEIGPGPLSPRRRFDRAALGELADSVGRYGILQPLTVRREAGRYELVAGQRRLRAARMAGLEEVPCLVMELDEEDCGVLALVENLQRQPLDVGEQARSCRRLLERFALSPEALARRLGKHPAAMEELLGLLALPEDMLEALAAAGLGERHGRALLRLPEGCRRREALGAMTEAAMGPAEAERYVEGLLHPTAPEREAGRTRFVLKDVRVFLNSLRHSMELLRRGGVASEMELRETEQEMTVTIHIRRQ